MLSFLDLALLSFKKLCLTLLGIALALATFAWLCFAWLCLVYSAGLGVSDSASPYFCACSLSLFSSLFSVVAILPDLVVLLLEGCL